MSIAGHASHAMLPRYSHVRMEARRHVLDQIATRRGAARNRTVPIKHYGREPQFRFLRRVTLVHDQQLAGAPIALRRLRFKHFCK
jgi:hypothetical protein